MSVRLFAERQFPVFMSRPSNLPEWPAKLVHWAGCRRSRSDLDGAKEHSRQPRNMDICVQRTRSASQFTTPMEHQFGVLAFSQSARCQLGISLYN